MANFPLSNCDLSMSPENTPLVRKSNCAVMSSQEGGHHTATAHGGTNHRVPSRTGLFFIYQKSTMEIVHSFA